MASIAFTKLNKLDSTQMCMHKAFVRMVTICNVYTHLIRRWIICLTSSFRCIGILLHATNYETSSMHTSSNHELRKYHQLNLVNRKYFYTLPRTNEWIILMWQEKRSQNAYTHRTCMRETKNQPLTRCTCCVIDKGDVKSIELLSSHTQIYSLLLHSFSGTSADLPFVIQKQFQLVHELFLCRRHGRRWDECEV